MGMASVVQVKLGRSSPSIRPKAPVVQTSDAL